MLSFDELNMLVRPEDPRNIDIDRYFDEMDLPESEREQRKDFARALESELYTALALIYMLIQYGLEASIPNAIRMVEDSYLRTVNRYFQADSSLTLYASRFANDFVNTTVERIERYRLFDEEADRSEQKKSGYWLSDARSKYIGANEANGVFNYEMHLEAIENGCQYKQWVTMKDERVRRTHGLIDGTVVRINAFFNVGDAQLLYPRDLQNGYDFPEETVNCRCICRYLTEEEFNDILRDLY